MSEIENSALRKLDFTNLEKVILEGEKESIFDQIFLYKTKNNMVIMQYDNVRK